MFSWGEKYNLKNFRPSVNVLGIDVGTENTVVAVWMVGKSEPEVITFENNEKIIPSYVWCKEDGTFDVGKNAVRKMMQYPQDVCYDAKQMIGQPFANITASEYWSFKVVNNDGKPVYELSNGNKIEPEKILTQVLKRVKSITENYVGTHVEHAVITVPAYFNSSQKQATNLAAKNAGLTILSFENEPCAAAFAFNYDHRRYDGYNLFVFDLGGGTFDITIISIKDGRFVSIASEGNNNFGGRNFDNVLMKELMKRLKQHGAQNVDSVNSKLQLRSLAEAIKISLTICDKEMVNCNDWISGNEKDGIIEITRAEFENLSISLKSALKDACMKALAEAKMKAVDFHNVLLIGGSSRMPMITNLLADLFPPSLEQQFLSSSNSDIAVAYGAAIRAAQLSDPNHRDYITSIIINCLPISIGIGLEEDVYAIMIRSGTKLPTKIKNRFFTTENNQQNYSFDIYEGERIQASNNRKILTIVFENLPSGLAGDVYVDITFALDWKGLLTVTAKSPTDIITETIDYRNISTPIEQLFKELAINAENIPQKRILMEARHELRSNMEHIRKRYLNEKHCPLSKRQLVLDNCKEVIDWLDEHPDKTLDEEIINLAKLNIKDAKEFMNIRLMKVGEKRVQTNELKTDYPAHSLPFSYIQNNYSIPTTTVTDNHNITAVGIDLGTSRCCVAVNRKSGITTVPLDNTGERLLPSFVAFDEEHVKCGQIVVERLRHQSKSTVFDSKRIIGRSINDIEIDSIWPFKLIPNDNKISLEIQNFVGVTSVNAEEVSAELLKHIKEKTEAFQGKTLSAAVITVPAAFTEELLPEPIAAALAYFIDRPIPNNSTVLLFDLGGGTLDVCIFKILNNQIHIISNTGDTKLGGRDFDTVLINHFNNILGTKYAVTMNRDKKYKLMVKCQKLKEYLSIMVTGSLDIDEFDPSQDGIISISREEFQNITKPLLNKIRNTLNAALFDAQCTANQINKVLHVGGGSRMPMIKQLLKDTFSQAEHCSEEHPDEVVAIGAAYYAFCNITSV